MENAREKELAKQEVLEFARQARKLIQRVLNNADKPHRLGNGWVRGKYGCWYVGE